MICSKNTDESLDECGRVQTNVEECKRNESPDESRKMKTSLEECRWMYFDINGGFPRYMFFNLL